MNELLREAREWLVKFRTNQQYTKDGAMRKYDYGDERLDQLISRIDAHLASQPDDVAAIGEVRDGEVVWFNQNPHAYQNGTKFYAASQPECVVVPVETLILMRSAITDDAPFSKRAIAAYEKLKVERRAMLRAAEEPTIDELQHRFPTLERLAYPINTTVGYQSAEMPEPVAWMYQQGDGRPFCSMNAPSSFDKNELSENEVSVTPLYGPELLAYAQQVKHNSSVTMDELGEMRDRAEKAERERDALIAENEGLRILLGGIQETYAIVLSPECIAAIDNAMAEGSGK